MRLKYKDDNPEKEKYNIKYDASVKVGINMNDIDFNIDNSKNIVSKLLIGVSISVTPVLAKQGIASITALATAKYAYRAYFPTRFKLNFLM